MNNQYNSWCKWHPLKTVMLGSTYPVDFYREIKSARIKSALERITEETIEDLENFEHVLKKFGCDVVRPNLNPDDSIMNYIQYDRDKVPRGPLQVRDGQFVMGKKLVHSALDHPGTIESLRSYNSSDIVTLDNLVESSMDRVLTKDQFDSFAGTDWLSYEDYLSPDYFQRISDSIKDEIISLHKSIPAKMPGPSFTVIGKDLYVDRLEIPEFCNYHREKLLRISPNQRINTLNVGGHVDGCFHALKPGAIISVMEIQRYENTFPGWEVCYLEHQGWHRMRPFHRMKQRVDGKWWVPGEEENEEFIYFVETWLRDWVGYVEETVFDVNVLMLDEHHVCVNNYNKIAFDFFKKHQIEPIVVPFRHRYFWDGGLHCITLDLYREGEQEDYFPDRREAIIDPGFQ